MEAVNACVFLKVDTTNFKHINSVLFLFWVNFTVPFQSLGVNSFFYVTRHF